MNANAIDILIGKAGAILNARTVERILDGDTSWQVSPYVDRRELAQMAWTALRDGPPERIAGELHRLIAECNKG